MIIQLVIEHLRACLGPEVFGATDFLDISENHAHRTERTWYVLPNAQNSTQQPGDGEPFFDVDQIVRVVVAVDIGAPDFRAEKAFWDASTQRAVLFKCLLGWQPAPCIYPLTFVSGQEIGRDGKRIYYAFDFTAREQVEVFAAGYCPDEGEAPLTLSIGFGENYRGKPHGTSESCPDTGPDCP